MKYYKATDSRGNEWATYRETAWDDVPYKFFYLTDEQPSKLTPPLKKFVSWSHLDWSHAKKFVEVQTNVVEIDEKEYRAIMKNRKNLIEQHLDAMNERQQAVN
tara:strand:+ start:1484 stop:1792 length:309 start_codon:yes stop_codon:yes gene_type:complete